MLGDQTAVISWAELRGFKVYVADNNYKDKVETIIFSNDTGYVYSLESGNSFDGSDIEASFYTPFVPLTDPNIRKAVYKLTLYTDPQGSINTNVSLKFDFDELGTVQPDLINLSNTGITSSVYGTGIYGTSRYSEKLKKVFSTQTVGAGFTVSLQFISVGTSSPFSLDAATLEFASFDRR
jgi:hypothetical protein